MAFAQVNAEYVQHGAGGGEDLVAGCQRVVWNVVPREFGKEGDHGFVGTLRALLGVDRLGELLVSVKSGMENGVTNREAI